MFELQDNIKNQDLKTIVEYYKSESIGDSAFISDETTLIAPIGIKGVKEGKIQEARFNPVFVFKVEGVIFLQVLYIVIRIVK